MTLLEKTILLAQRGYRVTIGDDLGYGIIVAVSKGCFSTSQSYSLDQLELGIVPTEWLILETIDRLVEQIDRLKGENE